MAISKAIQFLNDFNSNPEFRQNCYSAESKERFLDKLGFTENEFDDALNMNLVKCQTEEEAEFILQTKLWFSIF